MITVKDLIEKLQFLVSSNYLSEDDLVLIIGSGDKVTRFPTNVVMPPGIVDVKNLLNDDKGYYAIGFMSHDKMPKCKGWSEESIKLVEENFILGENDFEKASIEIEKMLKKTND
jgi:hypothetical protein